MFVREFEEYAQTMASKASYAYCKVAESDPVGSFKFFRDVCEEASVVNRSFPGFYQMFSEAMEVEKQKFVKA